MQEEHRRGGRGGPRRARPTFAARLARRARPPGWRWRRRTTSSPAPCSRPRPSRRRPLSTVQRSSRSPRGRPVLAVSLVTWWRGSDLKLPADFEGIELPELLWLMQMGIVLFWVHDRSPGQQRTLTLVDGDRPARRQARAHLPRAGRARASSTTSSRSSTRSALTVRPGCADGVRPDRRCADVRRTGRRAATPRDLARDVRAYEGRRAATPWSETLGTPC